jgi:hypothetical protein
MELQETLTRYLWNGTGCLIMSETHLTAIIHTAYYSIIGGGVILASSSVVLH